MARRCADFSGRGRRKHCIRYRRVHVKRRRQRERIALTKRWKRRYYSCSVEWRGFAKSTISAKKKTAKSIKCIRARFPRQ